MHRHIHGRSSEKNKSLFLCCVHTTSNEQQVETHAMEQAENLPMQLKSHRSLRYALEALVHKKLKHMHLSTNDEHKCIEAQGGFYRISTNKRKHQPPTWRKKFAGSWPGRVRPCVLVIGCSSLPPPPWAQALKLGLSDGVRIVSSRNLDLQLIVADFECQNGPKTNPKSNPKLHAY